VRIRSAILHTLRACDFFGNDSSKYTHIDSSCDSIFARTIDSRETSMTGEKLFPALPDQKKLEAAPALLAAPRLREPQRDQIELRAVDLDSLIGQDHPARVIWEQVEKLDMSEIENRIKARGETPGRAATSPRLLTALWLYAAADAVGSARALARLCECHEVYRWLCGGVTVNHHMLSDFRVEFADVLDGWLADHLAALAKAGVVDLDKLAQDGVRIRASAGASSFRREATVERLLETAQAVVEHLKTEVNDDPNASKNRVRAAKERAAYERCEKLKATQAALAEIKQSRQKLEERGGNGKKPKEPRASTTDPDARVMKMADSGFRPAYNVQVVSAAGEQIVVATEVGNKGSDGGQMRPMLERLETERGELPRRHIVDGGYCSGDDIEWAHGKGIEVYCPPRQGKEGTDPSLPRPGDGPGVSDWRQRMGSEAGKAQYRVRTICECIHARWRNWDLRQVTVRGIKKVRAVVLWYALANNILQGHRLLTPG
jgi:transposase